MAGTKKIEIKLTEKEGRIIAHILRCYEPPTNSYGEYFYPKEGRDEVKVAAKFDNLIHQKIKESIESIKAAEAGA